MLQEAQGHLEQIYIALGHNWPNNYISFDDKCPKSQIDLRTPSVWIVVELVLQI